MRTSPLWYLSKAIGKINITPPELAKAYLTNPDAPKMMNLFTFDKEELSKLRRDVLTNPEKYEELLTKQSDFYKYSDRFDNKYEKRKEYDYWYRILNQGVSPVDSIAHYKDMLAYRHFVEGIEEKALDTLKMIITRLMLDFDK